MLNEYLKLLARTSIEHLVVPVMPEEFRLSTLDIVEYEETGFILVRSRLDAARLQELNMACDWLDYLVSEEGYSVGDFNLEAEGGGWRGQEGTVESITGCIRKVKNLMDHSAVFLALALHPAVVGIGQSLLGDRIALHSKGFLMNKGSATDAEKRWHQDSAYFDDPGRDVITLWIPLQDTDEMNGTLWVLPGSHLNGSVAHQGPEAHIDLPTEWSSRVQALPMAAGDVFVSHRHTLHYSGPNRSAASRRAILLRYQVHDVAPQ
jgi:ectoine hydroxylase-related dioxygenase (phytanoyl-CoA dioxygenase family)